MLYTPARRVVVGDGGARFERADDDALALDLDFGDVRGASEGGVDGGTVAEHPVKGEVAWCQRPEAWFAGGARV